MLTTGGASAALLQSSWNRRRDPIIAVTREGPDSKNSSPRWEYKPGAFHGLELGRKDPPDGQKKITDYYPHVQYYGTVQYCVQQSAASPCWTLIALYDCTGFDIGIIIVARGAPSLPLRSMPFDQTGPARRQANRPPPRSGSPAFTTAQVSPAVDSLALAFMITE
jgi:hypothetical protein